jgi:hypothetical protein
MDLFYSSNFTPMHTRKIFALFSVLMLCSVCFSQKNTTIKWAPAALAMGKISFGSELSLKGKNALTIYAGIPFAKQHTITYDKDKSNIRLQTFSLMAGYRHYLSKKPDLGFYIEPFAKFTAHKGSGQLLGSLGTKSVILQSQEKYNGFGLGAQLGFQFKVGKSIVIDWFLLGPEINTASFNSSFKDTGASNWSENDAVEIKNDVEDVLKDIPVAGKKIKVEVNAGQKLVTGDFSALVPGIRSGLSVGWRF